MEKREPNQQQLLESLQKDLAIQLPEDTNYEQLRAWLSQHVHQLIAHQFNQLVFLLYRIDVSENKLRDLLQQYPQADAGWVIADLIIERQLQKIETRLRFKQNVADIPEDERW
jgi:hypothetical protein